MHHWLASKILPSSIFSKTNSDGSAGKGKPRLSHCVQPKPTSAWATDVHSASSSTTQLSKVSTNTNSSVVTGLSTEEIDCFRSMRGTSTASTASLNSAMSSDAQELAERLRSVQAAGERHKKVFSKGGQGYSILVTHEEVRICHVDEKGEYHYQHLPLPPPRGARRSRRNSSTATDKHEDVSTASSTQASRAGSRAASTDRTTKDKSKKPHKARRQLVKDRDGRTLVDITPHNVTVFHDGGVWRCHRMLGKIWDSDYATHVTARMPRAWSRRPSAEKKAADPIDAEELRKANGWSGDADQQENKPEAVELLLCSNTPGERGTAPRAFKSFYHDL